MPALPANTSAKILITGATGYVGQWVLRSILDRGHTAHIVVRSDEKANSLKSIFSNDVQKLSFVVVEDMTKEGAFDEAVVGVDAIVHVATSLPSPDPDAIRVAKEGTLNVLKAALKNGKNVKRIVITSTFGTIASPSRAEVYTYTEKDQNEESPRVFEAGDREPMTVYQVSKIVSEREALKFLEDNKKDVKFDVTFLSPPFVFGPTVQRVSSASELLSTSQILYQGIVNKLEEPPMAMAGNSAWIDVRDVGETHALALEREEAGGERILISGGSFIWREWFDVVRAVAPSVLPKDKADALLRGLPAGTSSGDVHRVKIDTAKSDRLLGLNYRTKEDLIRGVLEQAVRDNLL